nr:uncharacterized protein LOC126518993 isoform X6 [Dermacentor andersoni]
MDLGQRRWPVLSYRLHYTWQPAFKSLKEKVEKDTRSHFIARTGTETCGHLKKKHFYFVCHRSGSYASQATSKQKLKRPSSVKCGKRCFAAMAVTEDNTDKLREGVSMDAVQYWIMCGPTWMRHSTALTC